MSIKNYLKAFNTLGSQQIKRHVEMPDFRLGVSQAEDLKSQPVLLTYNVGQNAAKLPRLNEMSYEQAALNGVGDTLSEGSFDYNGDTVNIWAAIEGALA